MDVIEVGEVISAIYSDLGKDWGGFMHAEEANHLLDFLFPLITRNRDGYFAPEIQLSFVDDDLFYTAGFFSQWAEVVSASPEVSSWFIHLFQTSDMQDDIELVHLVIEAASTLSAGETVPD